MAPVYKVSEVVLRHHIPDEMAGRGSEAALLPEHRLLKHKDVRLSAQCFELGCQVEKVNLTL